MKKLAMVLIALTMTLAAHAQFEAGKWYSTASLTGLDLSYAGAQDLHLGINAKAGYLIEDNIMLLGGIGVDTQKGNSQFSLGAGGRYYIEQNGIFLGVNVAYKHGNGGYNDFMPGIEVGYAFFVNGKCTIEPAIYYDQSFKSHRDYSRVGIKIGIGIYL